MNIMPWRWNTNLSLLQDEMNRLFEGFTPTSTESFPFAPTLDVRETDKAITVYAELPGIDRKNVTIAVRGDSLEIKGQKYEQKIEDKEHVHIHERSYGSFTRRVTLPAEVDGERAEAKMNNGVLELRLPKITSGSGAKLIPVH